MILSDMLTSAGLLGLIRAASWEKIAHFWSSSNRRTIWPQDSSFRSGLHSSMWSIFAPIGIESRYPAATEQKCRKANFIRTRPFRQTPNVERRTLNVDHWPKVQ